MALIARHINEKNSKFVCVIARGEDGKYEVYNDDVVDLDELGSAAKAIQDMMQEYKTSSNG
jgi:hypothetical protein